MTSVIIHQTAKRRPCFLAETRRGDVFNEASCLSRNVFPFTLVSISTGAEGDSANEVVGLNQLRQASNRMSGT